MAQQAGSRGGGDVVGQTKGPGPQVPLLLVAPDDYPITLQAMKEHSNHPLRMKLEWDEIHRATAIKDAIHRIASLDDVSDFWCTQYALICKDKEGNVLMENVMERVEAMQVFRNQYEIKDSYQEGRRALRKFVGLCPNFVLAFLYDPRKGNYTIVHNLANIGADKFTTASKKKEDERDFMVGHYYMMLACIPDFQSIHKGVNAKVECKDMDWTKRHNMYLLKKGAGEGFSFLPFDVCSMKFYNTGVGGAVFNTMLRPILKIITEPLGEEWLAHKKLEFGLTYSEGLDSVFLVPDAATAQERALRNLEESLRLRFANERKFSLREDNWEDICLLTDDMVDAILDARKIG